MSMSQEEIEALMNESMDLGPVADETPVVEEPEENATMSADDIAALIEDADTNSTGNADPMGIDPDMDDILAGIDGITDEPVETGEIDMSDVNVDDILAGIDGITEDKPIVQEPTVSAAASVDMANLLSQQIDSGIYPMPVEKEHKVVNQLNEVAEDSEEKATKIFDVLSFILDENAEIQKGTKEMGDFYCKTNNSVSFVIC